MQLQAKTVLVIRPVFGPFRTICYVIWGLRDFVKAKRPLDDSFPSTQHTHHNEKHDTKKSKLDNMKVFKCEKMCFQGLMSEFVIGHMLWDFIHIINHIFLWFTQMSCSGKVTTCLILLLFLLICHINRRWKRYVSSCSMSISLYWYSSISTTFSKHSWWLRLVQIE